MKTAHLFAVAVITAASLPLMAQIDANATAQQSGSAGNTHVSSAANGDASTTLSHGSAQSSGEAEGSAGTRGLDGNTSATGSAFAGEDMRPVSGQLESKLDAKTAKPGEAVLFKTTEKMKTADGTEIPKGTRLVGHVTAVEAHARDHADSQLGIVFDRAEFKGGRSIPIHSVIESVSPPPSAMMASSMNDGGDEAGFGGGMGGGAMMAGGGGAAGAVHGGLLRGGGSLVGGAAGGAGLMTSRVGSGLTGAADGTAGVAGRSLKATGNVAEGATGAVDGLHGTADGMGSLSEHATGLPGVMLRGDASGAASGMLSASGKNVHLDSGTQMVLGVAVER